MIAARDDEGDYEGLGDDGETDHIRERKERRGGGRCYANARCSGADEDGVSRASIEMILRESVNREEHDCHGW